MEVADHAVFAVGSDRLGGKSQNVRCGIGGGDGLWRNAKHLEIVAAIAEYGELIGAIVAHVEQQANPLWALVARASLMVSQVSPRFE